MLPFNDGVTFPCHAIRIDCKSTLSLEDVKTRLAAYCATRPEIAAAYVFGSIAAGQAGPLSDIDIAFLIDAKHPRMPKSIAYHAARIRDLMRLLNTNQVDLVILPSSSPLLEHRIVSRGRCVYSRNDRQRHNFEFKAVQTYLDLKPVYERQTALMSARIRAGHFGKGAAHD